MMNEYKELNKSLWQDLEKGKVSRDYVLNNRFSLLFGRYNRTVDGIKVESRYRYYLDLQHDCIEGADELLKNLNNEYRLYVISNGVSNTQYKRLRDSNLEQYFQKIFISEDIGFGKPMKDFFVAVMKQIPEFDLKNTLIIGDSLTADILGGTVMDMDTCWFNPHNKVNETTIIPKYEINRLSDLYKILNG